MAPRTVYANLVDGLQPFSLWDNSLADMGSLGIMPCTAVGANAIVLTPIASVNAPNVTIPPQALQAFSFVAAANSTGPVTIKVDGNVSLKLYKMDGVTQATTGDLTATVLYFIGYNAALNGAVGGFQILAPISNEINPIISGATISGSTITTSTYNGNIWTAGTGTLTLGAGKTFTASNTLTFTGTDGTSFAFPGTSDTVVTLTATQTLTSKTLTSPALAGTVTGNNTIPLSILAQITAGTVLGNPTGSTANVSATSTPILGIAGSVVGTLGFANLTSGSITFQPQAGALGSSVITIPAINDQLVTRTSTDTLTNKTINGNNNTLTVLGASQISGNIPVANLNSGTNATVNTFWRGDGVWANVGSILIETLTASNSATISTAVSWAGFSAIEFVISNILPASANTSLNLTVNSGGNQTTTYLAAIQSSIAGGAFASATSTSAILLCGANTNNAGSGVSGTARLNNPASTTTTKQVTVLSSHTNATPAVVFGTGSGTWNGGTGAITGAQFQMSSGNMTSGTIKVFGIV